MTTPDERAVLAAAVQICDENEGGASAEAVAARLGVSVDVDVVVRDLLPLVADYFAKPLRGDDGVVAVRQPTVEARAFTRMPD